MLFRRRPEAVYELVTRDGCHLCDEMAAVLDEVLPGYGLSWAPRDVDAEPELRARFMDAVPVVVRSPLLGARNAGMMSPAATRRLQARRRLRELQVQLANWRGPGILAEAGEETLALGKPQEAEKLLREAKANGGAVEDVNFGLARSLEMQGRWP